MRDISRVRRMVIYYVCALLSLMSTAQYYNTAAATQRASTARRVTAAPAATLGAKTASASKAPRNAAIPADKTTVSRRSADFSLDAPGKTAATTLPPRIKIPASVNTAAASPPRDAAWFRENRRHGGPVVILSIDGGGVRGLMPAFLLEQLEKRLGKRCSEFIDVFAGSSSGGILALSLVKPTAYRSPDKGHVKLSANGDFSAEQAARNLRVMMKRIFKRPAASTAKKGKIPASLYPYDAKPLEDFLKETFGDIKLSQAVCPIVITSVETVTTSLASWTNLAAAQTAYLDLAMREAARMTGAAPGYFPPYAREINAPGSKPVRMLFTDGSIAASNPSMAALKLAMQIYPFYENGTRSHDYILISLGVGSVRHTPAEALKAGKNTVSSGHGEKVADFLTNGTPQSIEDACRLIFSQILAPVSPRSRYFRFNIRLSEAGKTKYRLDDAGDASLLEIKRRAQEIIDTQNKEWEELVALLKEIINIPAART